MDNLENSRRYKRARTHTEEFCNWLKGEVGKMENASKELKVLALGPNRMAKRFTGYIVNGFRFHTKFRDSRCTTQNSGVFLSDETTSFASSKDENPIIGHVNYYGSIEEIVEVDFWGELSVVLFKCCWYQEEKDPYGLTRVNFSRLHQKSDPFVLASQVKQVFYVEDPTEKMIYYVINKLPRDWCDNESDEKALSEDVNENDLDVVHIHSRANTEFQETNWCREDVPLKKISLED